MRSVLFVTLLFLSGMALADMDVEVQIHWIPPTQNVDGTPVDDLASYEVYYGRQPGARTSSYQILDPTQTSDTFTVLGVNSGESIYVVMTATDSAGNTSTYSNEVRFGPFVETDTVAPAWNQGALGGSARVVRCGRGTCTGGSEG